MKVSIVMPVYNGKDYICQTIDSVINQSFVDWELICINDSSTDNSLDVLEHYASKDSRIRVFTNPNGGSASKATKLGISKMAKDTKFYFYLSQDDLISEDLLEKCVKRATEVNAEAVMPDMEWYYADGVKPLAREDYIGYRGDRDIIIDGRLAFEGSIKYWIPGFFMISVDVIRRVGFYDFSYNSIDATGKLWLLNCKKIAFCDGRFFYRQDNAGAITKKISQLLFDALITNNWLYEYIYKNFNADKELLGYVKVLQLDDLISRRVWLFDQTFMRSDMYEIAVQKTKQSYEVFKKQGGYISKGGIKEFIKSRLINGSYTLFSMYVKLVNGK